MHAPSQLEILADELGAVAGQIERQASLKIDAAISDLRRIDAERELRLSDLVRKVQDAISGIKNGENGKDGRDGRDGERGEPGVPGRDGVDGVPGESGKDGADGKDGASGVDGKDGRDGLDGRPGVDGAPGRDGVDGKDGERGPEGAPGKLPLVRAWEDRVYYEGEVVSRDGSTYQANKDTGRAPPHEDWACIALAGTNGANGRSVEVRGTYKPDETYHALNMVALNGASFVAKRDNPGPCPGDGWQLCASQGKQGKPGERGPIGPKGEAGPAGPSVVSMHVDDEGLLRLTNSDGSIVDCDLYPLLSRLG